MTNKLIIALIIATSSAGCASSDPSKAIAASQKALVGIDFAAEKSEPVVDRATAIRVEQCIGEKPGDERRRCMGALGKPVAPIYEKAGAAYDAAIDALEMLEQANAELQEILEEAREVAK
jgi:hypothetical protein